jgi:CBS domain containing-hemolysin-like protein
MFTFLLIVLIAVYLKLVLVTAMRPTQILLSTSELHRRTEQGDMTAKRQLAQASASSDLRSLLQLASAILLIATALLSVGLFGWLLGIVISLALVVSYGLLSRLRLTRYIAAKLNGFYEPHMMRFANEFPTVMHAIGIYIPSDDSAATRLGSREELQELIHTSEGILSSQEKKLLVHGLSFSGVRVKTVMTPSAAIVTIKKSEFLGPLTLSELYKNGHSRLPVIDQDIDHVVGVLHLQSLLTLDVKHSVTAEKAMESRVFYIRDDQTLHHALAAFLRTHHQLFIVINEYRETVGLLTLDDVIEALLGRKIIDEFDSHEDKRLVALRNPHENNMPIDREDI